MVWFEKGFSIRALAHRGLGAASTLPFLKTVTTS